MAGLPECVLVTAIGSFSAKAVIDSLHAHGVRVVGCDIYPASWVVNSLDVDAFYNVPRASETASFVQALQHIIAAESVDMIIPSTDYEVDAIMGRRDQLDAIVCMSSDESLSLCRDKLACYNALSNVVEKRYLISTLLLADVDIPQQSYPAVCKPLHGRSSSGLFFAQSPKALQDKMAEIDTADYCMQPQIPGSVVTVDILRHDEVFVSIPRRELLRTPNGAGTSVEIFKNRELQELCHSIAVVLGIEGCVNFEFIEQEDGDFRFLECNPRFSGGVAFSQMSGYDFVANHIRHFAGLPVDEDVEITEQFIARRYTEFIMEKEGGR